MYKQIVAQWVSSKSFIDAIWSILQVNKILAFTTPQNKIAKLNREMVCTNLSLK